MHNRRLINAACIGLGLLALVLSSASPGRAAAPAGCVELLVNGSFEAVQTGWTELSVGGQSLITRDNPRSGAWGAYLGGLDAADDRLSQLVALPPGAGLTLRFWWSLETTESGAASDRMTVTLRTPAGAAVADLFNVDSTAQANLWDEATLDLSAYAGATVSLEFVAHTDAVNTTSFFVDDVSLAACSDAPTPTASPTVTPSATPSPTPSMTVTATRTPTASATVAPATVTATPSATATATRFATKTPTATAVRRPAYLPLLLRGG